MEGSPLFCRVHIPSAGIIRIRFSGSMWVSNSMLKHIFSAWFPKLPVTVKLLR